MILQDFAISLLWGTLGGILVQGPVSEASGSCIFRAEAKARFSTEGTRKKEGLGAPQLSFSGSKGVCWIKEGKGILCKRSSLEKWGGGVDCCPAGGQDWGRGQPRARGNELVLPLLPDSTHLPAHRCTHPAQVMTMAGTPPPTHLPRPPAAPTQLPSIWQVCGGSPKMTGTGPGSLCLPFHYLPLLCRWQPAPLDRALEPCRPGGLRAHAGWELIPPPPPARWRQFRGQW